MSSEALQYQQCKKLQHRKGHSDGVTSVAFSPNGQLLASSGMDGQVCIWELRSGKLMYVFAGESAILNILWLEQSSTNLVCGTQDGFILSLAISEVCLM